MDRGGYSLEIRGTIPFSNYGHEAKFNDKTGEIMKTMKFRFDSGKYVKSVLFFKPSRILEETRIFQLSKSKICLASICALTIFLNFFNIYFFACKQTIVGYVISASTISIAVLFLIL